MLKKFILVLVSSFFIYGFSANQNQVKQWKQKADNGDKFAMFILGQIYYDRKVPHSYETAMYWYKKSANKGNEQAAYYVALMYSAGKGVTVSPKDAIKWYKKSSDMGYGLSAYKLGEIYEKGVNNVPKDYQKAIKWYSKAADLGSSVGASSIAKMYEEGVKGVPRNYQKAVYWYERTYQLKSDVYISSMALLYHKGGYGLEKNYHKAFHWYQRANNPFAYKQIGEMYVKGQGVEKDYNKAAKSFLTAFEMEEQQNSYNIKYAIDDLKRETRPLIENSLITDKEIVSKINSIIDRK